MADSDSIGVNKLRNNCDKSEYNGVDESLKAVVATPKDVDESSKAVAASKDVDESLKVVTAVAKGIDVVSEDVDTQSKRDERVSVMDKNEADFNYVLWTELGEQETKDKFLYVEVKQNADIQKIYDERKRIEDLISEADETIGEFHTGEYEDVLKKFDTINDQTITQGYRTDCERPTAWSISLLYEKIYDTIKTFRLTVELKRRDFKDVPTKVDLTVSIVSEIGVELAFINFEGLVCNDEEGVSTIMMSTERPMASLPEKAKYNILLKVSGCCGQKYSCQEVWVTSKIPRINCKFSTLQKDLNRAKWLKYFSDVELHCGIETLWANRFILQARKSLLDLTLDPTELPSEFVKKSMKLSIKCCSVSEVMNDFFKFLYTGACEDLSSKNAKYLYFLANDYGIKGLKLVCKTASITNLTVSNFIDTLIFNIQCKDDGIREALLKYAKKHDDEIKALFKSNTIMRFDKELCEALGETFSERSNRTLAKAFT